MEFTTGTELAPGVHADIPDSRYHADTLAEAPSLSNSIAKELLRSPLHAWTKHPRLNPDWEPDDRKTFDIGRAAHSAVLGRGAEYVAIPEKLLSSNGAASTKAAKEWIEEARDAGKTPLKAAEVDQVNRMAEKLRLRLAEYGITLDPARSEMTAIAEIDGVTCRCRVDNAPVKPMRIPGVPMPRLVMIDFKTCEDASPEAFRRAVENYGYDFQNAFYREVWEEASGEARDMLFVFQEKAAPQEVCVVHLLNEPGHSGDFGEDARAKTAAARALWAECLSRNEWPGYPNGIVTLTARPFFRQAWQDKATILSETSKPTAAALRAAYRGQAPAAIAGE
ncbi:PD-(D/E)XK nuclease-like domain-containing protein [Sagittula sp. MA-2]|jgi:hypothetical protein|uniref:PD-(D/E)XK nuclease-like domain-containing protein n=1 Tax=Sagittula sp. MA-2 TaxID=3048007 RepID=UPI0024C2E2BF|nr:PD-(D/E)XK nuclease-like domain-containing protein [Sagittula sp. MA-2]WHZ35726.1 PD-(D/E)XK nuclease-like domain-containing protein [Sagittula sp. MA-2]